MVRTINQLTDVKCKKSKCPQDKNVLALNDGSGLMLLIKKSGTKSWVFRYTLDGKEKRIGLGVYPTISLIKARQKRDIAHQQINEGTNPKIYFEKIRI